MTHNISNTRFDNNSKLLESRETFVNLSLAPRVTGGVGCGEKKIGRNLRLTRDVENLASTAEVLVKLAMIEIMLRQLAV